MIKFPGRLLVLGCGSVAQCMLSMLFDHIVIDYNRVTIIDAEDHRNRLDPHLQDKIKYIQKKLTLKNYKEVLPSYLSKGDFLLDLAVEIDTCHLLQWCHDEGVLFLNTSVEVWDALKIPASEDPREQTLYLRHLKVEKLAKTWKELGPTAIIEHGANPGLVSHFAKQALLEISNVKYSAGINYAKLAYEAGIQSIHISEIDTQIARIPKAKNEFVNTWSCDGFIEEAIAPAELGIGTHERDILDQSLEHKHGLKHQILLPSRGCQSFVRSWVPSGEIKGMVIRHGEAYTLTEKLSYYDADNLVYRPTVHYAYQPCPDAVESLLELEQDEFKPQQVKRILEDEIVSGHDELGCLLLGKNTPWWIGTILSIEEARYIAPHQNATTVQVAISVIAGMIYAIQHPDLGLCVPDDLDHTEILKVAKPYLGKYISEPLNHPSLPKAKDWQFSTLSSLR